MIRRAQPLAPPRRARGGGLFPLPSPFRFLITVSAKALSGQLLRSLCYLHGRLPTDLLFPFQERLSRCPICICPRHLFLDFLLHFILSPTSQKARSKEYWWLQERGWGVFPLILWSLLPAASSAVFLRVQPREQMECGYQGANLCSAGPGSKKTSESRQYRTTEALITPRQKYSKTHYNCQPSTYYFFLPIPAPFDATSPVLADKICLLHRLAEFQGFSPSLLQSRE